MAKPKQAVLVDIIFNGIVDVWTDDRKKALRDILSIEGVATAQDVSDGCISLTIDKRYDTIEVADEIRELLSAEVPDIFKE